MHQLYKYGNEILLNKKIKIIIYGEKERHLKILFDYHIIIFNIYTFLYTMLSENPTKVDNHHIYAYGTKHLIVHDLGLINNIWHKNFPYEISLYLYY